MTATIIQLVAPVFKVAATEAELPAAEGYECQLTGATLTATPAQNQVPATGCSAATTLPSKASWALVLNWLQDWTAPGGGLSMYAFEHETELVFWSLSVDDDTPPIATGTAYVASGAFGGVFGGPPAVATATWPVPVKPDISVPV